MIVTLVLLFKVLLIRADLFCISTSFASSIIRVCLTCRLHLISRPHPEVPGPHGEGRRDRRVLQGGPSARGYGTRGQRDGSFVLYFFSLLFFFCALCFAFCVL
jgi:hypothetical protein